jgi:hypothetical protein
VALPDESEECEIAGSKAEAISLPLEEHPLALALTNTHPSLGAAAATATVEEILTEYESSLRNSQSRASKTVHKLVSGMHLSV